MKNRKTYFENAATAIFWLILGAGVLWSFFPDLGSSDSTPEVQNVPNFQQENKQYSEPTVQKTSCVDVTSYDYDWSNDMRCTRPDGSVFYTSYSGAEQYD